MRATRTTDLEPDAALATLVTPNLWIKVNGLRLLVNRVNQAQISKPSDAAPRLDHRSLRISIRRCLWKERVRILESVWAHVSLSTPAAERRQRQES